MRSGVRGAEAVMFGLPSHSWDRIAASPHPQEVRAMAHRVVAALPLLVSLLAPASAHVDPFRAVPKNSSQGPAFGVNGSLPN